MALLSVAMVILFPTSVYSVSVYASSPDEVPLATNFNKMFTLTKPTAGFFPIKKGVLLLPSSYTKKERDRQRE